MQYEKGGRTYEFDLDIDRIIEQEEADPNYSLMDDLEGFESGKLRFSTLQRLAGFIGTDIKSLKSQGLSVADLVAIFSGCIEDLGFTSEE